MKHFNKTLGLALAVLGMTAGSASAAITISSSLVGDLGNTADSTGYGSVGYLYGIGTFEVTLNEYAAFLNAVAKADPAALYNANMYNDRNVRGIQRSGSSGSYVYTVSGTVNRPVTYVSWFDAARFVNWLQNGQPTGAQGVGTTETGAYTLLGAMTGVGFARNAGSLYALPSENEWYKAAYYEQTLNAGSGGYWLYPTRNNAMPNSRNGSPSDNNSANFLFDDGIANGYNGGYAVTQVPTYVTTQNYLTGVGAFSLASSYYGTFDQGGNVREWTEGISSTSRIMRGGAWNGNDANMRSSNRNPSLPLSEVESTGFRVVFIPEPTVGVMMVLGMALLVWKRKLTA